MLFSQEQWAQLHETYDKWWNGELDRPIIKAEFAEDKRLEFQPLNQGNCHELWIEPEEIIDRIDAWIQNRKYFGDAFPMVNFDCFGPGVVAAFCGAELDNSTGRVWFHYDCPESLRDLHIEFDPNNKWFNRIIDLYAAGNKKWKGGVLMAISDMGGALDILASFRGTNNLLMDLYDEPEEVKRLTEEVHQAWFAAYHKIEEALFPVNPGYSDWNGLLSKAPSYVLQCDFSYMISPDMFAEFVLPELKQNVDKLCNTIFHMDGKGEIPHLDYLLSIEKLKAIQWQPGDGAPPPREWLNLFETIRQSGKNVHVVGAYEDLKAVAGRIGSKGIYHILNTSEMQEEMVREILKEYSCI